MDFLKRQNPTNISSFVVSAILVLFILVSSLVGVIPNDFGGEEFAVYHNANSYDHFTAWNNYFNSVGRPIAVAYWTYSYEFIGYNPILLHTLSFVLLLLSAILGAKFFSSVWPEKWASKYTSAILICFFFFTWVSAERVFKISSDQSHLATIFFFLSGLSLQKWARGRGRPRYWMGLSILLFLLTLLTYEAASFLYPVLLILAWPLWAKQDGESRERNLKFFVSLGLVSLFFFLVPYFVYRAVGLIDGHRNNMSGPYNVQFIVEAVESWVRYLLNLGNWLEAGSSFYIARIILLATMLLSVFFIWHYQRYPNLYKHSESDQARTRCIYFACAWLILWGTIPYALIGYGPAARIYHGAIYGIAPLLLLNLQLGQSRFLRGVMTTLLIASLTLSLVEFRVSSTERALHEERSNPFYVQLKEIVPSVKPNTVFIFIDYRLSNSGCGPSMNMLYDQVELECAFLSSEWPEYFAIRYPDYVQANRGGGLRNENWIIITVDEDGRPEIVPEIRPGDFGLLIYWLDISPIMTDFRRIEDDGFSPPSDMYLELIRRRAILFPNQALEID